MDTPAKLSADGPPTPISSPVTEAAGGVTPDALTNKGPVNVEEDKNLESNQNSNQKDIVSPVPSESNILPPTHVPAASVPGPDRAAAADLNPVPATEPAPVVAVSVPKPTPTLNSPTAPTATKRQAPQPPQHRNQSPSVTPAALATAAAVILNATSTDLDIEVVSDADLRAKYESQKIEIREQNAKIAELTSTVAKLEGQLTELSEVKSKLEVLNHEYSRLRGQIGTITKAFGELKDERTKKIETFLQMEEISGPLPVKVDASDQTDGGAGAGADDKKANEPPCTKTKAYLCGEDDGIQVVKDTDTEKETDTKEIPMKIPESPAPQEVPTSPIANTEPDTNSATTTVPVSKPAVTAVATPVEPESVTVPTAVSAPAPVPAPASVQSSE